MNKGRREGQGERANNNKEFSYVFVWCLFRSLIGPKSGQNPKKKKHPNLQPHNKKKKKEKEMAGTKAPPAIHKALILADSFNERFPLTFFLFSFSIPFHQTFPISNPPLPFPLPFHLHLLPSSSPLPSPFPSPPPPPSRLAPLTFDVPRALIPLNNTPTIDYTIEFLATAGMTHIFVFSQSHSYQIKKHVAQRWGPETG